MRDYLTTRYVDERRPLAQVKRELQVGQNTLRHLLKVHGIEIRGRVRVAIVAQRLG